MSRHSGENTLLQIFNNIKEKVDYLKGLIDAKQEPFIVTATADFQNGVLMNVSHTFAQIVEAYDRGDHIFLNVDISQILSGQRVLINLTNHRHDKYILFEQTMIRNNNIIFLRGQISPDNSNVFIVEELAKQTQLNGLTFKVSSSVPTVDDRSVITFVVEE